MTNPVIHQLSTKQFIASLILDIEKGEFFCALEIFSRKQMENTLITELGCELISILASDFINILGPDIVNEFKKFFVPYPSSEELGIMQQEKKSWNNFRKKYFHELQQESTLKKL